MLAQFWHALQDSFNLSVQYQGLPNDMQRPGRCFDVDGHASARAVLAER